LKLPTFTDIVKDKSVEDKFFWKKTRTIPASIFWEPQNCHKLPGSDWQIRTVMKGGGFGNPPRAFWEASLMAGIWQSPASVLGSVVNSGDLSIPCEHFWESGDLPIPVIIQKILFLYLYKKAGR